MPFTFLYDINKLAAEELINAYTTGTPSKTKLLIPLLRSGLKRVSEQELRFAFAAFIDKQDEYFYGVEVPTNEIFRFTGIGSRSASTDLAIFKPANSSEPIIRVECKSKQPKQKSIDKDIEKLMIEPCSGAYCHIFESENSGTLFELFKKLHDGILTVKSLSSSTTRSIKPLYFSFLILNSRKLITLNMAKVAMASSLTAYYSNLFNTTLLGTLLYKEHIGLGVGTHCVKDWQIDIF